MADETVQNRASVPRNGIIAERICSTGLRQLLARKVTGRILIRGPRLGSWISGGSVPYDIPGGIEDAICRQVFRFDFKEELDKIGD
jgi:hypothetical protein